MKNIWENDFNLPWEMENSEKFALIQLLSFLKPSCSIEIGTKNGGSLQVISNFSTKVYTLDIDSETTKIKDNFNNVEFITGDSKYTLPKLLLELESKDEQLNFVLIDGDHTSKGVEQDINTMMTYTPKAPLYILMHDSYNPHCRQGMRNAKWDTNPYVHEVELDFICGMHSPTDVVYLEMWGGFGLAVLKPEKRTHTLQITERLQLNYNTTLQYSNHNYLLNSGIKDKIKNKLIRILTRGK